MTTRDRELSENLRAGITKRMIQIVLMIAVEALVLFLAAGHIDWLWAWVFLGMYCVGILVNAFFMFRYSPETIALRASTEGMKSWDKVVSGLWAVMGIVTLVVAGLDERYGWGAALVLSVHIIGVVVYVLGSALFSWAMLTNAYFATVVRVQTESEHRVCTTGPYRYVRHPGYVGAILQAIGLPLLLGSLWALLPGIISMLLMVVRTALEDRTLRAELPGYVEYTQHTRYRLLPGIW